ncbi:MAG: hypothetical protein QOH04_2834 [Sphingomonadales bacterium]|jgi:type II secretory pathway component PulM|nr:hypothetical protein [Sphingomonadales bacterium]
MSLNDVAAIVNIVGVMLVVIFTIRWRGRPPRNRVVGSIGLAMIFVAAVTHLALWFSGRL